MSTIKNELYGLGGDFMKGLRYGQRTNIVTKSKGKKKKLVRKEAKNLLETSIGPKRHSRSGLGSFRNVGF